MIYDFVDMRTFMRYWNRISNAEYWVLSVSDSQYFQQLVPSILCTLWQKCTSSTLIILAANRGRINDNRPRNLATTCRLSLSCVQRRLSADKVLGRSDRICLNSKLPMANKALHLWKHGKCLLFDFPLVSWWPCKDHVDVLSGAFFSIIKTSELTGSCRFMRIRDFVLSLPVY